MPLSRILLLSVDDECESESSSISGKNISDISGSTTIPPPSPSSSLMMVSIYLKNLIFVWKKTTTNKDSKIHNLKKKIAQFKMAICRLGQNDD
jgi:hypothetical protein